jgi:hypothetical protein
MSAPPLVIKGFDRKGLKTLLYALRRDTEYKLRDKYLTDIIAFIITEKIKEKKANLAESRETEMDYQKEFLTFAKSENKEKEKGNEFGIKLTFAAKPIKTNNNEHFEGTATKKN